ncbi:hypothetical protein C0993_003524, partial [Termitomyces sp. T159_Od127]
MQYGLQTPVILDAPDTGNVIDLGTENNQIKMQYKLQTPAILQATETGSVIDVETENAGVEMQYGLQTSVVSGTSDTSSVIDAGTENEGQTWDQLVEYNYLRSLGIIYNQKLCCLICLDCHIALSPTHIKKHIYNHHPLLKCHYSAETFQEVISEIDGLLNELPTFDSGLKPFYQGLTIHNGLLCSHCDKIYVSVASMKKHHHLIHSDIPLPQQWETVKAQQLNISDHKLFFRIELPTSPPINSTDLIIKQLRNAQQDIHDVSSHLRLDSRVVSPFLQSTGWLHILEGRSIPSLIQLSSIPQRKEFPGLAEAVYQLFHDGEELFSEIPELVLQRLISPDPVKHGISNSPFKPFQDHKRGMKVYASCIVRLLAMLLRNSSLFSYNFTQEHNRRLIKLQNGLDKEPIKQLSMRILHVLISLWTHTWYRSHIAPFPDPTINCLALMVLQDDGSFKHPKYITGPIAHYQYCIRYAFMIEMHRRKTLNPGSTYEQHCADLSSWFTEKYDSTFNSLRSLQHRASTVAESTMSLPTVWWLDRVNYRTMVYKGNRIEFDDIKKMFVKLEADIIKVFEEQVLCGQPLQITYNSMADDLSNPTVGYSFVLDPRNSSFTNSDQLMRAILDNEALCARFIASYGLDGKPLWNVIAFRDWLSDYAKFHGLLLLRAEMLGGSPARGTELTAMTYRNIPTSSHRNLVAFGKHIAILVTYHKGTAMTGIEKLIPHSLDAVTSDLLIQDLVIARPFAQLAALICHPQQPKIWNLYNNYLFVNEGELFHTTNISNLMCLLAAETIHVDLGLQSWRQISIAFRRKTCQQLEDLMESDEENTVQAMQATHSRRTENRVYGLSADALSGVAEDVLPLYLEASTQWQIATGAVPGGLALPYSQARSHHFSALVESGLITVPHSIQDPPTLPVNKIISALVPSVIQALQPAIASAIDTSFKDQSIMQALQPAIATTICSSFQEPSVLQVLQPVIKKAIDGSIQEILAAHSQSHFNQQKTNVTLSNFSSLTPPHPSSDSETPTVVQESSPIPHIEPGNLPPFDLEALALQGLRKALNNPTANWSCSAQKEAVTAVLACKGDLCAILRTGAGKTMLAIIPALLETDKVTVVVLPLKSLVADYVRKLTAMKIPFELYNGSNGQDITGQHNLILVSADRIRRESWRQTIEIVNSKKTVQRLIFDEAHYPLIDHHFRSSLDHVHEIRTLPFQLVLLSATVPPQCRDTLCNLFGFVSSHQIISMATDRPELQYVFQKPIRDHVQRCNDVVQCIKHHMASFKPGERALVFVSLKDVEGYPISKALECDFYHGDLNDSDRQAAYDRWVQGINQVMVCTNAFGAGNDYAHVRLVIHAGTPRHMVTYVQEVGRGGRDGQPTKCILFPRSPGPAPKSTTSFDPKGELAFWTMLFGSEQCIRHCITSFIDGSGVSCIENSNTLKCSRCEMKPGGSRSQALLAATSSG